jgi:hypothetical protein
MWREKTAQCFDMMELNGTICPYKFLLPLEFLCPN